MIELRVKPAPLYGAWNGYLLISEDEKYYKQVIDEYEAWCQIVETELVLIPQLVDVCQIEGSEEETTFAELMDKEEATKFMGVQAHGNWLAIGFDTLHSWDTPETQTKEAVIERTKAWRDQLLRNMK